MNPVITIEMENGGSIVAELQVITGATNEMGFNKLSAR